jgi:hypothetical protein
MKLGVRHILVVDLFMARARDSAYVYLRNNPE